MAEIKVEKKKGNNAWIWIIVILVIAGIIWWIASADNDEEVYEEDNIELEDDGALNYNLKDSDNLYVIRSFEAS